MNNGSVGRIGTHDELLASNPIYQEVYYSQNKGGEQDENNRGNKKNTFTRLIKTL